MHLVRRDVLILSLFLCNQPLSLQRRHTARTGRRDGLAVLLVLDVAGGEHALDGCLGGTGYGLNVAVCVEGELGLDEGGGGLVACLSAGAHRRICCGQFDEKKAARSLSDNGSSGEVDRHIPIA